MRASDFVVTDLDGKILEGKLRPSSDLATLIELYRAFPHVGGVRAHAFARGYGVGAGRTRDPVASGRPMPIIFTGAIPVAGAPVDARTEIRGEYELNTGLAIVRRFAGINPLSMPAVLQ